MTRYGAYVKSTLDPHEINVIVANSREGRKLTTEAWFVNYMKKTAQTYVIDYGNSVELERSEEKISEIYKAITADKNAEKAQELINAEQNRVYNLYGKKTQQTINRTIIVK